jgi:tetratricopeptide (TPR) repeat protein
LNEQIREQLQATLGAAYTLERELGGGGMSRVFVAEETALGRKVVVKVLPDELTAGVNVERFNREILLAAKLQHPHIVPVLAAGETHGLPYYTMPFVEGESLRARLARGDALSITDVVGILRDVAKALAYAHERGIVHRDIKPDNVLLTGGSATVTDFGIAKAISASRTAGTGATLTQVGTSIGTPTYMSPEQAAGDPATDHRADIYSFGCMAYELLTGRPPFVGPSPTRLLAAHMGEQPRAVSELRPDTPASLADLVMRCLAKEPDFRPQQAIDLVHVLETVTSAGTTPAMPTVLLGGPGMFRKALALYAAAFVAVAVLAKAAIVGIGLPDWVFPGSLIVMALGLPVVLWTGYVQRVTRRAMIMTPTYTPGGSPATNHGTIATMALKAAPRLSWHMTARGGMYAVGTFIVIIAAFMAMRALGIGPAATLLGTGQLKAKDPIIMTDFSVTSGDTSLARVVSFAVRTALSQSPVLTIMNPAAIAGALERMERPRNARIDLPLAQGIALREGVKAIVDGEVTTVGTGYVLTVRLLTTDSTKVLASFQASGEGPQGLIEAADKVARDLRSKAGESLRSVQNAVPLVRARTASLEALRRYSEGAYANDVEGDWPKAIRILNEAVVMDTMFAEAWRKLGTSMSNLGMPRASVDSMMTKAYNLRSRLSDGEQASLAASYFDYGPGNDRAKSIAAYERAIALLFMPNINMAMGIRTRREFARAESLFRADLTADPTLQLAYANLSHTLFSEGRFDAADSVTAAGRRRLPPGAWFGQNAIMSLILRRRFDNAQTLVDSARGSRNAFDQSWALGRSAELALLRGRVGEWRRYRAQRLAVDSSLGLRPSPIVNAAGAMGVAAVVIGSATAEVAKVDAALARSPLRTLPDAERPDLTIARMFANAGRADRARAIVNDFIASVRDTNVRRATQPELHTTLGLIALAERKTQEAIAELRKGDMAPDGPATECTVCLPLYLGRAFDAANQPDSAIGEYEKYLATPWAYRFDETLDASVLPSLHERLGQLYEAKGNVDKAAEHYREFIELWKNADAELQPRVAAARARLYKLTPVERPKR